VRKTTKTRLKDIAETAGVSLATAGRVLQGSAGSNIRVGRETAERVRKIAEQLNYVPNYAARQLAGHKSSVIGILIDPRPYPSNSIRLAEMGFRAREHGYHIMTLYESPEPEWIKKGIDEFKSRGVDGIICFHHAYPGKHSLVPRMLRDSGFKNLIYIDKPFIDNAAYVGLDFCEVSRMMVDHLVNQGRKKVAFAVSDLDWHTGPCLYEGYRRAVLDYGLPFQRELVWIGTDWIQHEFDYHDLPDETADKIVEDIVINMKADSIVTGDDAWAAQIMNALFKAGFKCPEDVAVTGSGNIDISRYVRPRITTADLRYRDISRMAVDMLVNSIENGDFGKQKEILVKPEMIIRESA
jgi:DNA-binding LacI/PurR family transcriptional regulator